MYYTKLINFQNSNSIKNGKVRDSMIRKQLDQPDVEVLAAAAISSSSSSAASSVSSSSLSSAFSASVSACGVEVLSDHVARPGQIDKMVKFVRFIGQNLLDARLTKTTMIESVILKTLGRRRVVKNQKYDEEVIRCAINADGHCLFDSLAFLFLYHAHDTAVVSNELFLYGWEPNVSNFLSHGTCKGNMMEVLVTNCEKFVKSVNFSDCDTLELIGWFKDYKRNGTITVYPCHMIAYIVFILLFKSNNCQLCMHQLADSGGKNYLDPTVFVDSEGSMQLLPLNTLSLSTAHVVASKKKIHLWNCHLDGVAHFEPAVLQSEQKEMNLKVSEWTQLMQQRLKAIVENAELEVSSSTSSSKRKR